MTTRTSWLQAGAADQETINIGLLGKIAAVLLAHTAPVNNPGGFGRVS